MNQSLAEKAKLSVIWNTGFNLFRDALQFCVMLVLVRLLTPEAYGQFGLATSIIGFISVFAFQNFVAHTMQVRKQEEVHYQIHFTAGLFIQLSLFLITNIIAFGLKYVDEYTVIAPLIHVLSFTFLLEWPTELCIKMLEKELDWKRRRVLHGIGLLFSSVVAVGMGVFGFGVYALIVPGLLVILPFIYELFVVRSWRPSWEWNYQKYKPAIDFGMSRLGSGFLAKSRPLLESALIVQFAGFAGVGLLGRAVGLSTMFCQRLATQLMYSIYPVLTKVEPGTGQYQRMSALVIRVVAWVVVPIAAIFSILAGPVVRAVYGDKWLSVIELLPWAMLLSAIGSLSHVSYMLLLAHNEQKICLKVDFFVFVGNVVLLVGILPYGLSTYIQLLSIVHVFAFVTSCFYLIKVGGIDRKELCKSLYTSIFYTTISFLISSFVFNIFGFDISGFLIPLMFGFLFSLIYLLQIRYFSENDFSNLLIYMPCSYNLKRMFFLS